nr:hypothetical protein [Lachnospiraceae bacterium]
MSDNLNEEDEKLKLSAEESGDGGDTAASTAKETSGALSDESVTSDFESYDYNADVPSAPDYGDVIPQMLGEEDSSEETSGEIPGDNISANNEGEDASPAEKEESAGAEGIDDRQPQRLNEADVDVIAPDPAGSNEYQK